MEEDPKPTTTCGHSLVHGCVYCPRCGTPYNFPPASPESPGLLGLLWWSLTPLLLMARLIAPVYRSADLDLALNLQALRSGDAPRMRRALGILHEMAPRAQLPVEYIEPLFGHTDRDIALRARDLVLKMRR